MFGLSLVAPGVHAQEELRFQLLWTAPTTCPDKTAVEEKVRALLPNGARSQLRLLAAGHVTQRAGQYRLRLRLRTGPFESEQELSGASCDDVVGAAAVSIALLLRSAEPENQGGQHRGLDETSKDAGPPGTAGTTADTDGTAGTSSAGSRKTEPPKTEESGKPSKIPLEAGREEPSTRFPGVVLLLPDLNAGFGLFPDPSWGIGAGVGIEIRRVQALLAAWWTANPGDMTSEAFEATSAKLWHARVGVRLCQWQGPTRFNIGPCLDVMVEHLVARGEGSDIAARSQSATWMALGPAVSARFFATRRVAARATLGLHFQTSRPRLLIEGQGALGQVGLASLTGDLGVEWIF